MLHGIGRSFIRACCDGMKVVDLKQIDKFFTDLFSWIKLADRAYRLVIGEAMLTDAGAAFPKFDYT